MYCSRCGAQNPDDESATHCAACGAALPERSTRSPAASSPYPDAPGSPAGIPVGVQAAIYPYGGFWIRLVAYVIDTVILFAVIVAGAVVYMLLAGGGSRGSDLAAGLVMLLWYLLLPLYVVVWPPRFGATMGKLAVGYHIVDENGRHIGYGKAIARVLGQILSTLPLGLGYLWIGIDARKQGWHDKIAGTFVVRKEFVRM